MAAACAEQQRRGSLDQHGVAEGSQSGAGQAEQAEGSAAFGELPTMLTARLEPAFTRLATMTTVASRW
jgi:hypothetical protein